MRRHLALAGLCLAVFLVMTGMGMAAVALPERYLRLSGTVGASGWLASSFALSYMALQYPAGRWADRYGYRLVLALGCLLVALAALVFSLAHSPLALFAGRFVQGAGEAPLWAGAPALLGRLYPDRRGWAMGLYNAAFHVGLMTGPLVGACLMPRSGWAPFPAFSLLSLVAMVLVLFCLRGTAARPGSGTGPVGAAASGRAVSFARLWPLFCGVPLFGAAYGLLVSCLPVHLAGEAAFSSTRLGLFLLCGYAGIAVAQMGAGALSDRYGRARFMAGGLAATALGLAWFVSTTTRYFAAVAVMGAGLGAFAVVSMAVVNAACPDNREGAASGLYYLAWGTGYFAGPQLADLAGLARGALLLSLACLVAAGLVAWRLGRGGLRIGRARE